MNASQSQAADRIAHAETADIILRVEGVAHGGDGVGRVEQLVYFVPLGLPGDVLRVRVTQRTKRFARARIVEVIEPSPWRQDWACVHHGKCPLCLWGHFAYPAQGEWKVRIVRDCFQRIGGLCVEAEYREDPSRRTHYRTRAELHGDGNALGFYMPGTHSLIAYFDCPILHPRLREACRQISGLARQGDILVTVNPDGEEVLVFSPQLPACVHEIFPLSNTAEDKHVRYTFLHDGIPIVNGCFSQNSLILNRLLVSTVHEKLVGCKRVLDLFCGSGNLTLTLPKEVSVLGLDTAVPAVKAAARIRSDYRAGRVEREAKALLREPVDAVVVDPPRQGMRAVLPMLVRARAKRLIYASCDPATQARDVATLVREGWQVASLIVIDLYPHTPHVETVCELARVGT